MTFENAYQICLQKTYLHTEKMQEVARGMSSCDDGDYYGHQEGLPVGNKWDWLSSFVTGLAPIAYQTEHDKSLLFWANSFSDQYNDKVFKTPLESMHDLGFLYLPYSVHLWKLTGDKRHKETAIKAADELLKRFDLNGKCIDAWSDMDSFDKECRGIVDSMMNVPLLFWAWKETKHTFYYDVAIAHIETIKKHYVRPDSSVCHAFLFDRETGEVKAEANSCGFANGSHWARGTAWFVYGMAIAYFYTQNPEYLVLAKKTGKKFVECLTEADGIPVWDFRLPKDLPATECRRGGAEPKWNESKAENKKLNRDSSAASIMVCAFQLIDELALDPFFSEASDKMLKALCDGYLDTDPEHTGMLKCSDGCMTYTVFGDYYFMQALATKVHRIETCWI